MKKAIFIILTLAGFASGAEMEVTDRLAVDGSMLLKGTLTVSGAGIEVRSGTSTAYSLAVGTSTNYSLTVSSSGVLQVGGDARFGGVISANAIYKGTYTVVDTSMLDGFTLKLDTTTNKIRLADRIEQNIMLDAFKIAVSSSLSIFNMVDGIMDEFEDETGVDKINSSSQTYNSAGHYYYPLFDISGIDSNTKLMFHFNSPVNGSKEIQDSGNTGHIVTQAVNAALSLAQVKIGTCSLYLDGNSYISIPDPSDWTFGTGDFTIDCWLRFKVVNSYQVIFTNPSLGSTGLRLAWNNGVWYLSVNDGNQEQNFPDTLSINTWYHVALVKTSGVYKVFRDGVQKGSDWADTHSIALESWDIGTDWGKGTYGVRNTFAGYLDEFRISNTARWTTTFTPSTSAYTSDSNTKLLLHMESLDVSGASPKIPTFVGTAQLSTAQKEFGTASLFLNGSSDYVTMPDSDDWYFGTGDFTVDFRVRFNDKTNYQIFVWQFNPNNSDYEFGKFDSGHKLYMQFVAPGGNLVANYTMTNSWAVNNNQWYHLAFARNGANGYIFIDGVSQAVSASRSFGTQDVGDVSGVLNVGSAGAYGYYVNGWIDELRISKGIARWTTNFTRPTIEYSTTTLATYNMTLVSTTTLAVLTPSYARIVLFEEDVDTTTLNSDLQAYVSRNSTSTWSQVTLAGEGNYQSGRRILSGMTDLTGQPTGTAMRWKVMTNNSKNLNLHGVGLNWD